MRELSTTEILQTNPLRKYLEEAPGIIANALNILKIGDFITAEIENYPKVTLNKGTTNEETFEFLDALSSLKTLQSENENEFNYLENDSTLIGVNEYISLAIQNNDPISETDFKFISSLNDELLLKYKTTIEKTYRIDQLNRELKALINESPNLSNLFLLSESTTIDLVDLNDSKEVKEVKEVKVEIDTPNETLAQDNLLTKNENKILFLEQNNQVLKEKFKSQKKLSEKNLNDSIKLKNTVKSLSTEIETLNEKVTELKGKEELANKKISKLHEDNNKLNEENHHLLLSLDSQNDTYHQKIIQLQEKLNDLNALISEQQEKIISLNKTLGEKGIEKTNENEMDNLSITQQSQFSSIEIEHLPDDQSETDENKRIGAFSSLAEELSYQKEEFAQDLIKEIEALEKRKLDQLTECENLAKLFKDLQTTQQGLINANTEKEQVFNELTQKIGTLQEEQNKKIKEIKIKEEKLLRLEQHLEQETIKIQGQLKVEQCNLDNTLKEIQNKTCDLLDKEKNLKNIEIQLNNKIQSLNDTEKDLKQKQGVLESLTRNTKEMAIENENTTNKNIELREEKNNLKQDIDTLQLEKQKLEEDKIKELNEIKTTKEKLLKDIAELGEQQKTLTDETKKLESEKNKLESNITTLSKNLVELENYKKEAEIQTENLSKDINGLNEQKSTLEKNEQILQEKQQALKNIIHQLEPLNIKVEQLRNEKNELSTDIENMKVEKGSLEEKEILNAQKIKVGISEFENSLLKENKKQPEEKLTGEQYKAQEFEVKNKELECQLESKKEMIEQTKKDNDQLHEKNRENQETINQLNSKIENQNYNIKALENKTEQFTQQISTLEKRLKETEEEKKKEINDLKNLLEEKNVQAEKEIEELKEKSRQTVNVPMDNLLNKDKDIVNNPQNDFHQNPMEGEPQDVNDLGKDDTFINQHPKVPNGQNKENNKNKNLLLKEQPLPNINGNSKEQQETHNNNEIDPEDSFDDEPELTQPKKNDSVINDVSNKNLDSNHSTTSKNSYSNVLKNLPNNKAEDKNKTFHMVLKVGQQNIDVGSITQKHLTEVEEEYEKHQTLLKTEKTPIKNQESYQPKTIEYKEFDSFKNSPYYIQGKHDQYHFPKRITLYKFNSIADALKFTESLEKLHALPDGTYEKVSGQIKPQQTPYVENTKTPPIHTPNEDKQQQQQLKT